MAHATASPPQTGTSSRARRRAMPSPNERDIEVAVGLDFAWLDDPERERIRQAFAELFGRELDTKHASETSIDAPEHFGPMAPAVAAAREVEAELRLDLMQELMMPSSWPWARHRRSRFHLAR